MTSKAVSYSYGAAFVLIYFLIPDQKNGGKQSQGGLKLNNLNTEVH